MQLTPAAGFVTPMAAIVIGGVAAPISYYAIRFRQRIKLDESLDVWVCHGMGDGIIFIHPVEDVIRIRTRERGSEALMYEGDIDAMAQENSAKK